MIRCIAVDDEPLALRQIETYISKVPYLDKVALCSSASEATKLLQNESVDLMFVDINMPDISGMDFVKSLDNPPMVIFT
ncbi:MAG: response regulator, partial [Bacteroidales bacterium]|nr:response regulator [Bacteroidales bacterium]